MPEAASSHAPLYVQIAGDLKARLLTLEPGARLPSEPQLAKEFSVSRFTVTRAVEQLVDEGLITRRQGSGTFVAEAPLRRAPGYLLSFTEAVSAAGHIATHQLLSFGAAQPETGLPYPEGAELVLLDRLRLVDGVAVARHRSLLSADLIRQLKLTRDIAARPDFSLYRFFDDNGLSVQSATERLVACVASAADRKLLSLSRDGVVVSVTRHSFAADGTPLDAVAAIYDARRYSYEARLVRQHEFGNPIREEEHENSLNDQSSHIGPRLGPWGGERDGG